VNRRIFLESAGVLIIGATGASSAEFRNRVVLEGLAGEELPFSATLYSDDLPEAGIFEVRQYDEEPDPALFREAGIPFLLGEGQNWLFVFENLEQRRQAWIRTVPYSRQLPPVRQIRLLRRPV
jgi:hypothetical protein